MARCTAPDGSPWTFWYYPPHTGRRGDKLPHAEMLVGDGTETWARSLTLYGVQGCRFAGVVDNLPTFHVPGHGVQSLSLGQLAACAIARMSEAEAGNGGVRQADLR